MQRLSELKEKLEIETNLFNTIEQILEEEEVLNSDPLILLKQHILSLQKQVLNTDLRFLKLKESIRNLPFLNINILTYDKTNAACLCYIHIIKPYFKDWNIRITTEDHDSDRVIIYWFSKI